MAERSGNVIDILEGGERGLRIRLDDSMVDLDEPVIVRRDSKVVFEGLVPRTRAVINRTLKERGDPAGVFTAEVIVPATK